MNDQGGTAFMKERIGPVAECDAGDRERRIALSIAGHGQVLQITEVRMRILGVMDAVMGAGRVKVAAGGSKRRPFALPDIVYVNAMVTRSQLRNLDGDFDSISRGCDLRRPDFCSLRVHDFCVS